jgi:hypothetical protein
MYNQGEFGLYIASEVDSHKLYFSPLYDSIVSIRQDIAQLQKLKGESKILNKKLETYFNTSNISQSQSQSQYDDIRCIDLLQLPRDIANQGKQLYSGIEKSFDAINLKYEQMLNNANKYALECLVSKLGFFAEKLKSFKGIYCIIFIFFIDYLFIYIKVVPQILQDHHQYTFERLRELTQKIILRLKEGIFKKRLSI